MNPNEIEKSVASYYSEKIRNFGPIPQGVDWNGRESQELRFEQLLSVVRPLKATASLLDYGCGYGALLSYMREANLNAHYHGFDISDEMIAEAKKLESESASWISDRRSLETYDYVVASGLFNVRGNIADEPWLNYILQTLDHINSIAKHGFAFNILTQYSDEDRKKSNLYYANPTALFERCKKVYSKSVALLHDYPLYEFTIVVRKNLL